MTTKVVTDEMLGNLARRQNDLFVRVSKGSVDFDTVMDGLQLLQENNPVAMVVRDYSVVIAEWQRFYKDVFDMDHDFSSVKIPEKPKKGKWRLLVIAGISLETLYAKCKELFPVWRWTNDDFDKIVVENERDAKNGAYAIWVKDVVEADENLRNLSANDIKRQGITTETLAERVIHEIKYFKETGEHLDFSNVTLCTGSRYRDGRVPGVDWYDGKMNVDWCRAGGSDSYLRSRQAVS